MTGDDLLPDSEPNELGPGTGEHDAVTVAEPSPEAVEEAEPDREFARLVAERDEYLDALKRLQAEFENFRKRTLRQQTDLLTRASEGLVERLFPVLDALDLALAHAGEEEASADHLKEALGQISSLLRDILAQEGLERIDASEVPFDPIIHDAVAHVPRKSPRAPDGKVANPGDDGVQVVEVMRAGYCLKGRVLRAAMVKVEG